MHIRAGFFHNMHIRGRFKFEMSSKAVREISGNLARLAQDEADIKVSFNKVNQILNSPMLKVSPFGTDSVCKSLELLSERWAEYQRVWNSDTSSKSRCVESYSFQTFHNQVKESKGTAKEITTILEGSSLQWFHNVSSRHFRFCRLFIRGSFIEHRHFIR